jgi:hypothetical protein
MFFMRYWTVLYATDDQDVIRAGVETMMKISTDMLKKSQEAHAPRSLMSGDGEMDTGRTLTWWSNNSLPWT